MARIKKPAHDRHPTFLKAWRTYRGLSQDELADRVDVDRTTIGRLERSDIPYNQDILERLAFALGCEVEDILSLDPLKPDPPRLVYQQLKAASPEQQHRAIMMLEALLKAG